jgi:hypothetical protein
MARYGEIQSIKGEIWVPHYPYKVSTGIRYVNINLEKYVPSQVTIVGYKTLITYDGQKHTCFTCQETTHYSKDCPYCRSSHPKQTDPIQQTQGNTWANVVQHGKTLTAPKDPNNMEHDNQYPQQVTNNLELLSTHDAVNDNDVPKNTDSGHEAQTNKTPGLMGVEGTRTYGRRGDVSH